MSARKTQLLSSGEFCKLRYDTVPIKGASEKKNVSFYTNNSKKCQILSCNTLDANKRYVQGTLCSVTERLEQLKCRHCWPDTGVFYAYA